MSQVFLIAALTLTFVASAEAGIDRFNSDPVTVKLFSESPTLKLTLSPLDETSSISGVEYQPNVGTPSGISLSYAGLFGFSYITEINEDAVTDEKGNTSYDDYRFTFAFDQFSVALKYLRYKGMYIDNSAEIDGSLPASEPFIRRNDVRLTNYSGQFNWVFNHQEYSQAAILDQTIRQNKSGGSWMAGLNISKISFSDDEPLVPSNVQSEFGDDAALIDGDFITGTVSIGYGHNWVIKQNFYVGISIMAGTGYQHRRFDVEGNGETENTGRVEKFDARIALGYNGDRFFIGAFTEGDTTTFETNSIKIKSELINFQIFIGTRF